MMSTAGDMYKRTTAKAGDGSGDLAVSVITHTQLPVRVHSERISRTILQVKRTLANADLRSTYIRQPQTVRVSRCYLNDAFIREPVDVPTFNVSLIRRKDNRSILRRLFEVELISHVFAIHRSPDHDLAVRRQANGEVLSAGHLHALFVRRQSRAS